MKNIFLFLFLFYFSSCSKKTEIYDLYISNAHYKLNIKTGEFNIDWYKNYKEILELLCNSPLHIWKEYYNSKNFIEYYDCRLNIPLLCDSNNTLESRFYELYKEIINLCKRFFCDTNEKISFTDKNLSFNFYKNITKNISDKHQLYPHKEDYINCIFYMDQISSGGTALYPKIKNDNFVTYREEENLLVDTSKMEKILIESKPNRLVLFDGNIYHGGYVKNHDEYLDNWRITQVLFLTKQKYSDYK
jgi:hypothetical protein